MNPFEIPGYIFQGYISIANINAGDPIPLFSPAPPPEGNLSINTLDGWNKAADEQNRRSFVAAHGRDPIDDTEIMRWIYSL